jgi:purine nucleosidase
MIDRRTLLKTAIACSSTAALSPLAAMTPIAPRMSVIVDNDFSGDPDGLFQLAHQLLSASADIPLIVGSHIQPGSFFDPSDRQAANAAAKASELLRLLKRSGHYRVVAGSETAMANRTAPADGSAAAAVVDTVMRASPAQPLYYAAGGGLTDLALAFLREPAIASRIILIWIGGSEHPGLALPPPGSTPREYNFAIDPMAAEIIFNESAIEIWQVPRDAYRQMLMSFAELDQMAKGGGRLGKYLRGELDRLARRIAEGPEKHRNALGDTYIMGDSPLVTLTALQAAFQADPSSSSYERVPTPLLRPDGSYAPNPKGRPMRVYTRIDTRLTFSDMLAKFRE